MKLLAAEWTPTAALNTQEVEFSAKTVSTESAVKAEEVEKDHETIQMKEGLVGLVLVGLAAVGVWTWWRLRRCYGLKKQQPQEELNPV